MHTKILYHTLHFEDKQFLVQNIRQYNDNNETKSTSSKNDSSRPYQSLDCMVTVPEMNKVTRKSQF